MKALVFDLDGTLIDSLTDIILSFQHGFHELGLAAPEAAAVRAEIGRPLSEMYARFAPVALVPQLVESYRAHYPQHFTDHTRLYPGVAELLETLRERGYKLAVATTKQSWMARQLAEAVGLAPLVDYVQGTDDFAHKPEPEVIRRALAALNADGLWMAGDTRSDILAGKAAGLKTYAVTWGTQDEAELAKVAPDALEPELRPLLHYL